MVNTLTGKKVVVDLESATPYKKVRVQTNGPLGSIGEERPDEMFKSEMVVAYPPSQELRDALLADLVEFVNFCDGGNRLSFYYQEQQGFSQFSNFKIPASGDCLLISNVYHDEVTKGGHAKIGFDCDFGEVNK